MTESYKDLFRGAAWYYARYRSGYPEAFFKLVRDKFELSKVDRVLDLGCGTGQIAIPVCRFVREVVAMDPEPEMIAEGKKEAEKSGASNIMWVEGGSDDLPNMREELGTFKLVAMGTSFHWMNQEKTLEVLYEMIHDGGGIVTVDSASLWTKANEWQSVVKTIIQKWLGEERRAGSGAYKPPARRYEEYIGESRFRRMETWKYSYAVTTDIDSVIGNLYSTSGANPNVLGNKKEAFEKDLRETLSKLNPSGKFMSEGEVAAILAWK